MICDIVTALLTLFAVVVPSHAIADTLIKAMLTASTPARPAPKILMTLDMLPTCNPVSE